MKRLLKAALLMLGLFVAANVFAQADSSSTPLHPEKALAALSWLKANGLVTVLLVGMVWKYAPFTKSWSNDLIPWANVVAYVLATFAGIVPASASTGGGQPHNFATTILLGFLHSGVAKVFYDGWLKPHLDASVGKWTGTVPQ